MRFSTTAKKVLPRNTDFICGNQKRTANPHKCTFSCGIGRDFHITLKLVGGPQTSYEHICLVLPTSVSGTTQLARLEISGGPPRETHCTGSGEMETNGESVLVQSSSGTTDEPRPSALPRRTGWFKRHCPFIIKTNFLLKL